MRRLSLLKSKPPTFLRMSLSPMETPPVVTTTSPRSRQVRSLSRRESGSSTAMPQSMRGTECCDRSEISVAWETTI